ncbi:MAG: amidohydrolase [Beijerinckiaceae bacterium]
MSLKLLKRMLFATVATMGMASSAPAVDTIYTGGAIVTVDDARPSAEAVAVKDGRIVAVGSNADVMKLRQPQTAIVDIAGRTMIPGFIDAHGHMAQVGLAAVAANLLPPPDGGGDSIAALQKILRDWAAGAVAKKYGLILGNGYDDAQLKEQRHPTRDDLDKVSTELPVVIIHQSGHLASLNSKALEMAGFNARTQDPAGGFIRRREGSSEPNGVLEETAMMAVFSNVFPKISSDEQLELLKAGQEAYVRYGQTTAQEGRAAPSQIPLYKLAAERGLLKIDVNVYPDIDMLVGLKQTGLMKAPDVSPVHNRGFRIAGVKLNLDGSPQGKTAWLTQPYLKPPYGQGADYKGYATHTDAEAFDRVRTAFINGWQILAHVNGDAAIQQFNDAVRAATNELGPADRRPVAIHAQTVRSDQLDAMKSLGIFPAMFPMHTFYWGDWHRDSVLGLPRAADISPTNWALQRGMLFSSHHDAPVTMPNTSRVFAATVNRVTRSGAVLGPDQRVEPIIALKSMTLWSAHQHFEENRKGSITPGKLADFAILDRNPLTADRVTLSEMTMLKTIKEDKVVYDAAAKHGARDAPPSCFDVENCQRAMTRALAYAGILHTHEWLGDKPHPLMQFR